MINMNPVEQNQSLCHSLFRELEGLKIRIAFAKIDEAEDQAYPNEALSEAEYGENAQAKVYRAISQELGKQARKRFVKKTLPRGLQVLASIILLFFLSLTAATAASHTVRIKVLKFIISMGDEYAELRLENVDNQYFEVPPEWNGSFYMSYIPSGFSLERIDPFFNSVLYMSSDGRSFMFRELNEGSIAHIDTKDSIHHDIILNGQPCLAVEKDGVITIAWSIDNHYFSLRFEGSLDEATQIAQAVRMLQ